MAKIETDKIILTKEEILLLNGIEEFEIIPNQEGVFLLIDKKKAQEAGHITCSIEEEKIDELAEDKIEIIEKIKQGKLSELVEGKFEKTLTHNQLKTLQELIKEEKVILFKLNETYKKGVYKINTNKKNISTGPKESEKFNTEKKAAPEYNLEKDGFIATTNTERARILSTEYKEQIENNELRGIKTFDGVYYLISDDLIEKHLGNLISIFEKQNEITLEDLAKQENISTELTKIICEFLKEDGEILEKTKEKYKYIN